MNIKELCKQKFNINLIEINTKDNINYYIYDLLENLISITHKDYIYFIKKDNRDINIYRYNTITNKLEVSNITLIYEKYLNYYYMDKEKYNILENIIFNQKTIEIILCTKLINKEFNIVLE